MSVKGVTDLWAGEGQKNFKTTSWRNKLKQNAAGSIFKHTKWPKLQRKYYNELNSEYFSNKLGLTPMIISCSLFLLGFNMPDNIFRPKWS